MRSGDREEKMWRAVEGELSDGEWEAFQKEILADPEALEEYAAEVWIRGNLEALGDELPELLETNPPVRPAEVVRFKLLPTALATMAAALVGAVLTWWIVSPKHASPVATLVEAEGCRWSGSDLPTTEGSRLSPGKLALTAGMATLQFDSGARIIIEAPTTLEVRSAMECRLLAGSLVGDVPESAHGFTVLAPELEIVDLGTRFGVTSNEFGKSHVMVFDGEVEVTRSGETGATSLKKGNTLLNGSQLTDSQDEIDRVATSSFPRREGWVLLEAMKDAYVRKGKQSGDFGSTPLMMVKETELSPTNRRRGIMSFDLSAVRAEDIDRAEVLLDVEPSGLGFSTLIPDSRFAIYGLLDDSLDGWDENGVSWDTLPGVDDEGPLPPVTRKLGTFEIRRGASASSSVRLDSPELVDYLRKDANRIATFLIVRETGEYESQGLVHAFATREHPVAKAPALNVKLR